ncbi:MAG: RNA 3'-terminal phosphate cyclase [Deltaproteobacteria bacterium]|nr:RNA 3'-terminal phosphate cyclase [Nannocystaceae bacterium]
MIEIDGSEGEGGGQILRTALALAIIRGEPLHIRAIRAKRKRPGLLRQHLTAVQAAATVSAARVSGDRLGSDELRFEPTARIHGEHRFAVGTAGSATLVLQTVLWPLLGTPGESTVVVEGGTHNPLAPPFEFLDRVLLPVLRRMGAELELELLGAGFYPAGGGAVRLRVVGGRPLQPLALHERGAIRKRRAQAIVANLKKTIGHRELAVVREQLGFTRDELEVVEVPGPGPGNLLLIEGEHDGGAELVSECGEKGLPAETVAQRAVDAWRRWHDADVPVGEHLADQLLIPLALAGSGGFTTLTPTEHTRTNAALVQRLLGVPIAIEAIDPMRARVRVGG